MNKCGAKYGWLAGSEVLCELDTGHSGRHQNTTFDGPNVLSWDKELEVWTEQIAAQISNIAGRLDELFAEVSAAEWDELPRHIKWAAGSIGNARNSARDAMRNLDGWSDW